MENSIITKTHYCSISIFILCSGDYWGELLKLFEIFLRSLEANIEGYEINFQKFPRQGVSTCIITDITNKSSITEGWERHFKSFCHNQSKLTNSSTPYSIVTSNYCPEKRLALSFCFSQTILQRNMANVIDDEQLTLLGFLFHIAALRDEILAGEVDLEQWSDRLDSQYANSFNSILEDNYSDLLSLSYKILKMDSDFFWLEKWIKATKVEKEAIPFYESPSNSLWYKRCNYLINRNLGLTSIDIQLLNFLVNSIITKIISTSS